MVLSDRYNRKSRYYLISIIAIFVGIIILAFGFIRLSDTAQSISYVIGGGLFVSGIFRLADAGIHKQRWQYEDAKELSDQYGILDIQSGRGRAEEEEYRRLLRKCQDRLHIQAISLTRFRGDMGRLFEEKARSGVEIRLLLMDPDSQLREWYEDIEPERNDLEEKINQSVEYYEGLEADNLEVKFYDGLPNNYFRIDNKAFIGPYFVHISGRRTVTLLTDVHKQLGSQYKENFDELWEHSREP